MAEAVSAAAAILGIIVPALHGTRLLLDDIKKIKDAPDAVSKLAADVESTQKSLELLQTLKERDWETLGTAVQEQCKAAVSSCDHACKAIDRDLGKWTKCSRDGTTSWRHRVNVGFFKTRQLKAMTEQLQNCKSTFNSAVTVANLYSSLRIGQVTKEIRNAIVTQRTDLSTASETAQSQLAVVTRDLEQMDLAEEPEQDDDDEEEDRVAAMRQLRLQVAALHSAQALSAELLTMLQDDSIKRAAGSSGSTINNNSFGAQNSGQQIGVNSGTMHTTFGARQ